MMNIWPEVNDIKLPTLNRSGFAISNLRHFIPVIEISKNHQLKTSRPFDGCFLAPITNGKNLNFPTWTFANNNTFKINTNVSLYKKIAIDLKFSQNQVSFV